MSSRTLGLGDFALWAGDYQKAETLYNESAALCQEANNRWFPTILNNSRVWLEMAQGHYTEASRLGEEALSIFREYYLVTEGTSLHWLQGDRIQLAWIQGDEARVLELANEVCEHYPKASYPRQIAEIHRGLVALAHDDLAQSEALLKSAAELGNLNDFRRSILLILAWISLYVKQGQAERAVRLLSAIDSIYQQIAPGLTPRTRSDHDADQAAASASLGTSAFKQAWMAGEAMTLDDALDFVRQVFDNV
jgi:tetratricopeptide (TPR) repeat protein